MLRVGISVILQGALDRLLWLIRPPLVQQADRRVGHAERDPCRKVPEILRQRILHPTHTNLVHSSVPGTLAHCFLQRALNT